ncbi:MarR family transcriptional regulator [candidate division KSB1 bacterium]|nr:MarR family transcriptional regulator [candidate division KSB1 bacterium]
MTEVPIEFLERFSNAFIPSMHFFHNLTSQISHAIDLTLPQYRVLMLVYHRGPMAIGDLQQQLQMAQSSASEMVTRLVQLDLLYLDKNHPDRRITVFDLTDKARQLLKNQQAAMQACFGKVLTRMPPAGQIALIEAFETIRRLLTP